MKEQSKSYFYFEGQPGYVQPLSSFDDGSGPPGYVLAGTRQVDDRKIKPYNLDPAAPMMNGQRLPVIDYEAAFSEL